ncbi:glutaredoxin family protein [Lederbergia lenta]|uniref:glutaredoxin family protein n=1 Tax=Lederbergia lenta TaxID=1467 RepID=UPI000826FFD4
MGITFYTKKNCMLCEDAELMLRMLQKEYGFDIITNDIETNEMWMEKYGISIPVVEIDGELIQEGIIDLFTLEEQIQKHLN